MNVQMRRLDEIRPYENNPRKNDQAVDAVAASIQEFGFRQPIVIDKNGVIIAGHTRYKAANSLAAYFVGSLANTKVMAKMKEEKGIFFVRAVFSTLIGQFLDDLIFIFGAFYGTLPVKTLVAMVAAGVLCETLYEIVIFPITKKVTEKVGKEVIENEN